MIVLERSYTFSASHLYRRPDWSEERNRAIFGKCALEPAHGHNYRLTLRVLGEVASETGFAIDLAALDSLVKRKVIERLDHRHINDAVAEFAAGGRIPTSENLALWIADEIGRELPYGNELEEVRLAEDDRLASLWRPDRVPR